MHQPSKEPSGRPGPSVVLVLGYTVGLGVFAYFLVSGLSYYLTPVAERARHPDYWTFKPGGSLGLQFGAAGLVMMTVMHLYSARKRVKLMRGLGPLRNWLDGHILMGILGPLFVETPFGTFLWHSSQEKLYVGVGKNHRPNIAPVHHCSSLAQLALPFDHRASHLRNRGHD